MTRKISLAIALAGLFLGMNCKDESCTTCPPISQDSTSHKFVWQTFTFGGNAGGCVLSDVAIMNDTLAYAVGAIYLKDSLGSSDPLPYNLAKWDGNSWQLVRVTVQTNYGQVTAPFYGIYLFSSNDIWISSGLPVHGDGKNWTQYDLYSMGILGPNDGYLTKVWGANSNDIYFVGTKGTIAHYSNGSWQKIESGTTLDIHDIWGANDIGGSQQVLAVASNDLDKRLLRIQGNSTSFVADNGLANSLSGIWFVPNRQYYVVGAGIHYKGALDNSTWNRYPSGVVTSYASGGIRGTDLNDLFVVGSFFEVVHYNGSSWYDYRNEIPFGNGALGGVAVKGNLMITVGLTGQKAIAMIGKREVR